MQKKSFSGFKKPRFLYSPPPSDESGLISVATPAQATFLITGGAKENESASLKVGDTVKTGQKLALSTPSAGSAVLSVTGVISRIAPFEGDFGKKFTAITIDTDRDALPDDSWANLLPEPAMDTMVGYLGSLPGAPDLSRFLNPKHGIHTLVILGVDKDLLTATQQTILSLKSAALSAGIRILKKITGVEKAVLVVPQDRTREFDSLEATVTSARREYPAAFPLCIMSDVFKTVVPAGKRAEDMGVTFFTAEAAASIGSAFEEKKLSFGKMITVVGKNGRRSMVQADIGTPIRDILAACGETLREKDRLIMGGPMTGTAVYSELHPIQPDTDAVMLQAEADIAPVSDTPCINCGECIRICPAHIPVNLLIRFLEAGAYEDAAILYDLQSCLECGLCSYVCVARIPIFQHIRLARHELAGLGTSEAGHV